MSDKEKFMKNYTGIFQPEAAWRQHQAQIENKERFKNATYSSAYNKQLEREANQRDFNKNHRY